VIPVRSLDNTARGNNPEMPPSPQMPRFVCLHLESMVLTTRKNVTWCSISDLGWANNTKSCDSVDGTIVREMSRHGYCKVAILHSKVKMSGNRVAEFSVLFRILFIVVAVSKISVFRDYEYI